MCVHMCVRVYVNACVRLRGVYRERHKYKDI